MADVEEDKQVEMAPIVPDIKCVGDDGLQECEVDPESGTVSCAAPAPEPGAPPVKMRLKLSALMDSLPAAGPASCSDRTGCQVIIAAPGRMAPVATPVLPPPTLRQRLMAEFVGTFIIVFVNTAAVVSAVVHGGLANLWTVAIVSGLSVTLAVACTASISGAHLNPAVSLMFATVTPWGWKELLPYCGAQLLGAIAGGGLTFGMNHDFITAFEDQQGLVRGDDGSQLSAMVLCLFFPNPTNELDANLSPASAFAIEAMATGVLCFIIMALTSPGNTAFGKSKTLVPLFIGFTVAVLIALIGPLTQAGMNPARDMGPRIVAAMAGWKSIAFPGPRDGFWVYLLGPLVGGPAGGWIFRLLMAKAMREHEA